MAKEKEMTPNQFKCNGCGIIRTILPKFHKSIDRSTWQCKDCRKKNEQKELVEDKGIALAKKIDYYVEKENFFPKNKSNAIEKFLVKEYLIKKEIKWELKQTIEKNNLKISKGVVTTRNGKLEGSGDCDLIIFDKKALNNKGGKHFGEIVSIDKNEKYVKAIISIYSKQSDLKKEIKKITDKPKKNNQTALQRQKNYCKNIFAICHIGNKESKDSIAKKIKNNSVPIQKDNIFFLKVKGDFDNLINKLKE